jgi:hypothetical protein
MIKAQPQKVAVPNDKDIPAGYELYDTFDLKKGDYNSDVLSSCEHLANQKTPFKAEFWNTNMSLPHWQNAHIDPATGKLETCHNLILEDGYPYRILVEKIEVKPATPSEIRESMVRSRREQVLRDIEDFKGLRSRAC